MLPNTTPLLWPLAVAVTCLCAIATGVYFLYFHYHQLKTFTVPVSVNYFFTRKCNKECAFCFHTENTSYVASEEDMQRGLRLLREAGMRKINFAGGEPFLYPKKLAMLCRFCKEVLALESVSIITNGTKVTRDWLQQHGRWVDMVGVSCDSFDERTNLAIGRGTGDNVAQLFRVRDWCRELEILFKLNTVVCAHNWEEDMADMVARLDPARWKVFQVLYVEGENDAAEGDTRLNKWKPNAKKLLISAEQFETFCGKHRHLDCFIPEPNSGSGVEKQSSSILDVGMQKALSEVYWDQKAFKERGGIFEWSKDALGAGTWMRMVAAGLLTRRICSGELFSDV
ncbi:Radical S-adenosyl methionine domain-containing protein 2 [Apiospora hydei]|uniref:Radical S-adenosyl methionine domain-containing protein 2 n=1 Tax=Apiospora hydei TaxID=1337664 RepID=A0ABR1VA78_9PEZI